MLSASEKGGLRQQCRCFNKYGVRDVRHIFAKLTLSWRLPDNRRTFLYTYLLHFSCFGALACTGDDTKHSNEKTCQVLPVGSLQSQDFMSAKQAVSPSSNFPQRGMWIEADKGDVWGPSPVLVDGDTAANKEATGPIPMTPAL